MRLTIACLLLSSTAAAAEFDERIRPYVKRYCQSCHSAKAKKGGLDLQRFGKLADVIRDIEPWQSALEMLETGQMPPKGKPQPTAKEKKAVITFIRTLLKKEAARQAGDPGPMLLRRLSNSEYRYSIRDLTGYDLNVGKQFAPDGAAGEGFLNASSALTISPERLRKYLAAAKEVAAHAVLLPDGFRFSPAKFREDWVNEGLARINKLYHTYGTEIGGIPVRAYFDALERQRDRVLRPGIPLQAGKLSPKYLSKLRMVLTWQRPLTPLLRGLKERWLAKESPEALTAHVNAVQALLWHKRVPNGGLALQDRFVSSAASLITTRRLRVSFGKPKGAVAAYVATHVLTEQRGVRIGPGSPCPW